MNKVLIIDDDKELCALMKKCIEQEKLSAVTVYNGIEGVRLIDENKDSYSLIILDVMLPDIDGFQILQKIRDTSNMNELQKKNSKYILLQVSDIPKTSLVLERQFGVTEYSVQDEHTLRIYDTSLDMAAVNKALVVQDIAVISSQLCNDTLEDYFKKITGGEGIA